MKKPDWFKLVEENQQDPYVNSKVPFGVMFTILIAVTAIIFLFPSKTADTNPTPTVEIIQTPLDPITMPTITTDKEDDAESFDEDSED